jgi:DNA-3-methyladenine glycosylase II
VAYLSGKDTVIAKIIDQYKGEELKSLGDPFITLLKAIIGQQISVKAAEKVFANLASITTDPTLLLALSEDIMKSTGLSKQKICYIKYMADFFCSKPDVIRSLAHLTDDEIRALLLAIKGIGNWTVDMFLIFHLLRPNVLPISDIGLKKAIGKHYGDGCDTDIWQPYRTVASWYLWRSLDPVAVQY